MPIAKNELEAMLRESFPNAQIEISSLVDDNNHYSVKIMDESFVGKTRIAQHKMVNAALKELLLSETLHAMQLHTSAPK